MLRTVDNIVLGFSTPKAWNPVSWIVRKFTKSKASHAWVAYYDPMLGIDVVAEAHEFGFRIIRYDKFISKNNIVAIFRLGYEPSAFMTKMSIWLGTMYDFAGLFGMAINIIGRYFGFKAWKNPFHSPDAVFCSESIVRVLQRLDPDKYSILDPDNTSPQDLLDYMYTVVAKK